MIDTFAHPRQVYQLNSDGTWQRLTLSLSFPDTSHTKTPLVFTPRALAFDQAACAKMVFRGKWTGPKLDDGASLEAVFCGQALPVTCTPLCCDWSPGEEIKVVLGLDKLDMTKSFGSLKFNVWSRPVVTLDPSESAGIETDVPAFIISTFTALVLPPGSAGAVDELDKILLFDQTQGLIGDLGHILDSDIPQSYSQVTAKVSKWITSANCPALSGRAREHLTFTLGLQTY